MKNLKILHVIGQRPEMTGSAVYLQAIIRESRKLGFSNYRIAGVPLGSIDSAREMHHAESSYVFFESEPLNFPVPGMSDVMPYKSSLFKDLRENRLTAYKSAFTRTLQNAVNRFDPDIIHTNHLFVLSALVRKLFPDLPVIATCHGTDLRQYNNCPHLRPKSRRKKLSLSAADTTKRFSPGSPKALPEQSIFSMQENSIAAKECRGF